MQMVKKEKMKRKEKQKRFKPKTFPLICTLHVSILLVFGEANGLVSLTLISIF